MSFNWWKFFCYPLVCQSIMFLWRMVGSTWLFVLVLAALPMSKGVQDHRTSRQAGPGLNVPVPYSPIGYFLRQTLQSPALDAIRDIVLVTVLGIPLMGLMAMGGLVMLPLFGVNLGAIGLGSMASASSSSSTSSQSSSNSSGIKKKKWKREVSSWSVFGRMLDLMDELESILVDQGVLDQECKYRSVCEAHLKIASISFTSHQTKQALQTIRNLIREEQELETVEYFPFSKLLFSSYVEAAQRGLEHCNCAGAYPNCTQFLRQNWYNFENEEKSVRN